MKKLTRISLKKASDIMNDTEMKAVIGGQVVVPGGCNLNSNNQCKGGCAQQYANGKWVTPECTKDSTSSPFGTIYTCNCIY